MIVTTRRPGVTLMEVLIAIFIMSIGTLAILALFPIGAVNMARAIQQDRGTTQGMNADSTFRYYWAQSWRHPISGERLFSSTEAFGYSEEPMHVLLSNHPAFGAISPTSSQPSFPVLVDPVGWQTKLGTSDQIYVGDSNILPAPSPLPCRTTLRRCISIGVPPGYPPQPPTWSPGLPFTFAPPPFPYPTDIKVNIRLTTLLDDFTYDNAGQPAAPAQQLERGGRYNVAWLIRCPRMNVPDEITLHVLVYAGRSPTDTPSPEHTFPMAVTGPGQKLIQFPLNGQPVPPLRKGAWVAYSRVIPAIPDPVTGQPTTVTYPTLDFYRVAGVNDETPGQITVELDTAVRAEGPPPPIGPVNYTGTLIVFENLLEVFERGMLSAQGGSGR